MPLESPQIPIGGARPAPPPKRRFVPLWRQQGPCPTTFCCLHAHVYGFNTHYIDGRIRPCMAERGCCKACADGWRPRWRGFIGGAVWPSRGRYLMQCTQEAWRSEPLLEAMEGRMLGTWWSCARKSESPQAEMRWAPAQHAPAGVKTEPFDVLEILSLLWGLELRQLFALPQFDGDVGPLLRPYAPKRRPGRGRKGGA